MTDSDVNRPLFASMRPRYEVWTYLSADGEQITAAKFQGGPLLKRFWRRSSAERWGESITNNPLTLVASMDSLQRLGRMVFAEYEVRRV